MASAVAPMNSSATWGGSGNSTSTAASSSSASSSTISSLTSPFLFGSHHYQLRLWPRQRQQHASTKRDDNNNNNKRGRRRMRGNSNGNRTRPTSSNASFVVASSMVDILAGWIAYEGNIDQHHLHHLFLGVGVGLPCTVMPCGDIIYRSTLPQPTGLSLTAPGVGLALAAVSYLWATPGVAPGFWDMFVLSFLERAFRPSYGKDDFVLGRKLGEGAFGVVYRASLSKTCKYSNIKKGDVVVKKATEYGAVEIWMNERVRRACSSTCADFVYGFLESPSKGKGGEYWLVWDYEGEQTLADLMTSKEFPYNVETMILGEVQNLPKGLDRENKIIQTIMRQLLFALDGLHSTGIVHRDIKPQNIIFSQGARSLRSLILEQLQICVLGSTIFLRNSFWILDMQLLNSTS